MTDEERRKLAERAALHLAEHFDHVQILVTWNEGGLTKSAHRGAGNWYARQGLAHEFINQDIAQDQAVQIAERLNKPDDSDDWKAQTP